MFLIKRENTYREPGTGYFSYTPRPYHYKNRNRPKSLKLLFYSLIQTIINRYKSLHFHYPIDKHSLLSSNSNRFGPTSENFLMNSINDRYLKLQAKLNKKKQDKKPRGKQRYEMIMRQGNACAICGERFKNEKLTHIDHCHTTGKIRGILCVRCNVGLGQFKDNIISLQQAIKYLTKWNEKYKDLYPKEMTLEQFEGLEPYKENKYSDSWE